MFPFQKTGELSFQTMEFVADDENHQNNAENQIFWTDANASGTMNSNVVIDPNNNNSNNRGRGGHGRGRGRGRGRRSSAITTGTSNNNCNDDNNDDDEQKRKTIHREVERQRRLEMSNLYASLRSSLPPQYIQGKRSTSDHIAEAANYIKDLEKNVKDLADKRDELQATSCNYHVGGSSNSGPCQGSVVIEPRLAGLSIDVDVGYEDESFGLSSALQIAFEEGLNVLSCTSTRVEGRLIHNIVCEVNDITSVDFNRLQWRLNDLVS